MTIPIILGCLIAVSPFVMHVIGLLWERRRKE